MDAKIILKESRGIYDMVVDFRRDIHRNPELSFREKQTSEYIMQKLTEEGLWSTPIAGTGILVRIEGSGDLQKAVVLRADIDALPVTEAVQTGFTSENEGVMHACGHDLHTAALMGALILINRHRKEIEGTVFGLFQPGEELLPGGASMVLTEEPFAGYDIRAFYGEHVEPELPTGVFGFRAGEYMASTDELYFTVRGEGGHGAMRHDLKDPVQPASHLISKLLSMGNSNEKNSVLSIGRVVADGATNIIPDVVEIEGTLRTFNAELRSDIKERIREISTEISKIYDVAVDVEIRDGFPSVVNSAELVETASSEFIKAFGESAVIALDRRMTGEDFGLYTRRYPSLFYRFGVGGSEISRTERDVSEISRMERDVSEISRTEREESQITFELRGKAGKLHSPVFCPDERSLEYAVAGLVILALRKDENLT